MGDVFSVPVGVFLLLLTVLWRLPHIDADLRDRVANPPDDWTDEEYEAAERDLLKSQQRVARALIVRMVLGLASFIVLLVAFIDGLGAVEDQGALALLTGLYGTLLLFTQRAERNRRLATLGFMAFCGLLVWRFANFRELSAENNWGILAAVALNYLFWVLIGRRFPPGSSEDIYVWGMDDG